MCNLYQTVPALQMYMIIFIFLTQAGPAHPFKTQQMRAVKNTITGFAEPSHVDKFQFETQRRTFHSYGKVAFIFLP